MDAYEKQALEKILLFLKINWTRAKKPRQMNVPELGLFSVFAIVLNSFFFFSSKITIN